MASREVLPLNTGWRFKAADQNDDELRDVNNFPTNIHVDLLNHGLIPDPFVEKNEDLVQWVGEKQWVYRTTFPTPSSALAQSGSSKRKAVIAFDGLDTFATVVLNGKTILETENMFIPERVDITEMLHQDEAENELVITFDTAYMRGWKLIEKHPDHKWGCWNGDNSRLAVRKAQYHWGWDWGPTLLTCGPWRPVNMEIYESRLSDLYFNTSVDESLKSATIEATADVEGDATRVRFEVSLDGESVASETVDVSSGKAAATFHKSSPSLWYPTGYGKQPLYTIKATLLGTDDHKDIDMMSKRIGLRRVELVQEPVENQTGTSFYFRINNIPIFCGGSNWIPADNFIPRIPVSRYHDWVKLVAAGNQCMIRVWGGGIYEEPAFYSACDELGVLVWQDFMFACGNYPVWPSMLDSIRREAEANIRLMRHHPSIVIWAGNNEDYQYAESVKLTIDWEDKDPQNWLKTDFPARYIYEELLAKACASLIPNTYYHPGSPFSGGRKSSDKTIGDLHQWNVWHGRQEPYQNWDRLAGRFVSEFGMQALPALQTVDAFLETNDPRRYEQSDVMDHHNKAADHARRAAAYLVTNLRYPTDPSLKASIYASQLVQAECLATAYRLWRRQWKGHGKRYVGGALVWQINDCWPCTSWSIADYYLRPKMAWYAIKREMAKLVVGVKRSVHRHPKDRYSRVEDVQTKVEVWASNLGVEDVVVDVVLGATDIELGWPRDLGLEGEAGRGKRVVIATEVTISANSSVEILPPTALPVLNNSEEYRDIKRFHDHDIIITAYLFPASPDSAVAKASPDEYHIDKHNPSETVEPLARCVNWPEPLKYILFSPGKLEGSTQIEITEDRRAVELTSTKAIKGVVLTAEPDCDVTEEDEEHEQHVEAAGKVVFKDNCLDLVPGERIVVEAEGLVEGVKVEMRYLGMDYPEYVDLYIPPKCQQ